MQKGVQYAVKMLRERFRAKIYDENGFDENKKVKSLHDKKRVWIASWTHKFSKLQKADRNVTNLDSIIPLQLQYQWGGGVGRTLVLRR